MIKYQKKGGIIGMGSLIKKIDAMDKCIFVGKNIIHHTEYKPNCKECNGYKIICEQKNLYEPKWKLRQNLPPEI